MSSASQNDGSLASSLTVTQKEILTELQKILMTVEQINNSLVKTIALTKEGGEMRKQHEEAKQTGEKVFGDALGKGSEAEAVDL